MKQSVKVSIYQAIIENRWLNINYVNSNKENTTFYIAVKDIDIKKEVLSVEIFNPFKSNDCLDSKFLFIKMSGIQSAVILEQSYYDVPNALIDKVTNNPEVAAYLEAQTIDNNILSYLSDCYKLDTDPFLKEHVMVDGLDQHTLSSKYQLNEEQFMKILDCVFKKNRYEAENINRYVDLAMNVLSIDINNKQYVVAYKTLFLDFKNRTLKISKKSTINKSFLVEEDKRMVLGSFIDISQDEFVANFDEKQEEYKQLIVDNFRYGETINTRPNVFLIGRNSQKGVEVAFESINEMERDGNLTQPLKSFFGRNRNNSNDYTKNPNIVVFDKNKINIDQMRVIYNSMNNNVTFVKGPPGTGKTETIFNVLLSAYTNDKTVLVCSNNNHPVDDIYNKMKNSFHYEKYGREVEMVFPIIRLGNNQEMVETIETLRRIVEFAKSHNELNISENKTEASKTKSLSGFSQLKDLLKQYERRNELLEHISTYEKLKQFAYVDKVSSKIDAEIQETKNELDSLPEIKEQDVAKYSISASEDKNFQNYLYFSAMSKVLKILQPTYTDLRSILKMDVMSDAVLELNRYLKDDKNLNRFISIFPIVLCTNLSCDKLGSPKPHFDLCIMDESGQCNIASSLIPIIRADKLLLVGDTNQLQPVTVIENNVHDNLLKKYEVGDEYNYVNNSILSTFLRKDANAKNILLRYHYRCGKRIASFVNSRFYEEQLKLLNTNEGNLKYVNVKNNSVSKTRNSYIEEARNIVKVIKDNNYKDVGIITPFVNQAELINDLLVKEGIHNIKAGTIHTLQGSEKSVIIMSAALSIKTSQKTMDWIKNNHELINVGVTRAKESFIFVGDKEAIDLKSKGEMSDIKSLSDYVFSNGEMVVPKSDVTILTDFSNNSQSEKDFFETVGPYFRRPGAVFKIERNVPVKDTIKTSIESDIKVFGKKEFDFVVKEADGLIKRYKPVVVFEIDGGEHIGNKMTAKLDRAKEEIAKKYGIKIIRIANSQVKDYELIIRLFQKAFSGLKSADQYEQMSLFE